jgi:serine/threonine protein kinase
LEELDLVFHRLGLATCHDAACVAQVSTWPPVPVHTARVSRIVDPPEPGVRLGPYRLVRCIAQGGMGEVHLATLEREAGFRKLVAVKRALPHLAQDPHVVSRVEREARLAAVLTHRHIVQVFDFGRADGAAWLAMEYVHGVDVKAAQDRLGPVPFPTGLAVEIGLGCARGLHHAHQVADAAGRPLHLVHRDVSPHNVLLSFDGDVKLTDFGLADAATGPEHPDGMIQGKYAYMSPEQARGGAVDARSDQYALAVMLYELLSGARAFQAVEGPLATLDRVTHGVPLKPLAALGVPGPLVEVVERAMRPEADARYPDLAAFADALRSAAVAAGVVIGEPPLAEWLRALFPERGGPVSSQPPTLVHEGTAAADAPISAGPGGSPVLAAGFDQTLDAVAPAALQRPAPTPTSTPAPAPDPPHRGRRAWAAWAAAAAFGVIVVGGTLAVVFGTGSAPTPEASPQPTAPASLPAAASLLTSAPASAPALAVAAAPTPSAAPVVTSSPVPPSRPGRRPGTEPPRPALAALPGASAEVVATSVSPGGFGSAEVVATPAGSAEVVATPAGSAEVVATPAATPAGSAEVVATPVAAPATPPTPRVRVEAEGANVRDAAGGSLTTWRTLADGSVLAHVTGGSGPPVSVRLLASGRNVRANVTARPYGDVTLDGIAMGGTPVADLPLRAGRRRIVVRGPDASETRLVVEVGIGEPGP